MTYTEDQVRIETLKYFNGDELANNTKEDDRKEQ